MKPTYLDIHIHTSENPNQLNNNYDVDTLLNKIGEISQQSSFLISLTDHNCINKTAYLSLLKKTTNVLLGVELHIKNYDERAPYHCHIIFDIDNINETIIDEINSILNVLYPNKIITPNTQDVPTIDTILREFNKFEFILLPHGGQSHSTFDKSIPGSEELKFDNVLERYIYYNQFDGFTARSNEGLENSINYFKKLGINEFVNLVTCTDNYDPNKYPNSNSKEASEFIATWMLAKPTFNGLRLSLSESSRLIYSNTKPNDWSEYIESVKINNDKIDIDVKLTPGLNVVIGPSSSGKTLFIDTIYRKLCDCFEESVYNSFDIEEIEIENPSDNKPHYISQNYIIKVIDPRNSEKKIDDIELIKNIFPEDSEMNELVTTGLVNLKDDLFKLMKCVENIQIIGDKLSHYQIFTRLILSENVDENIVQKLIPSDSEIRLMDYNKIDFEQHNVLLDNINDLLKQNPFSQDSSIEIDIIKQRLKITFGRSSFEKKIREIIKSTKLDIDRYLTKENEEQQIKKKTFEEIINCLGEYSKNIKDFYKILSRISSYHFEYKTQEIKSMGHTLFIENSFILNKEKFVEISNKFLETSNKIDKFDDIVPESFFKSKFMTSRPNITSYNEFSSKIYSEFEKLNKKEYKIITSEGKDFYTLSAGWKTAVILDLILGYDQDIAPIIIDQPEDNLATGYINGGLISAIKETKSRKQVILVSHNATIPMLGDAQNIVLCQIKDNKIYIRSAGLEDKFEGKDMLDYIAEITDGGKQSIKKRVKKYNLKQYKE